MILCCGEALIDMMPVATPSGSGFVPHAGGSVFNTAIALGRLGAPVGLFSGLGADFLGDLLRQTLAASRVDTAACVTSARPSTLAFVRLVAGQARYAFFDEGSAGRMLTLADLPEVTAEALFFGGISLVAEPCAATYEALLRREAGRRVIMIDPNIRPGFITEPKAYRARLGRMLAAAEIVKLSVEDLHWLAAGDGAGFVKGLLARGTALVCVTDGARGVRAFTGGRVIEVPARAVPVVDTLGAGDTFNAGLLAGLQRAGALTRARLGALDDNVVRVALDLGVAAAAVTVSRAGADPPWSGELA